MKHVLVNRLHHHIVGEIQFGPLTIVGMSNDQPNEYRMKKNVIYFDPHRLQMTDHICHLSLGLKLKAL